MKKKIDGLNPQNKNISDVSVPSRSHPDFGLLPVQVGIGLDTEQFCSPKSFAGCDVECACLIPISSHEHHYRGEGLKNQREFIR